MGASKHPTGAASQCPPLRLVSLSSRALRKSGEGPARNMRTDGIPLLPQTTHERRSPFEELLNSERFASTGFEQAHVALGDRHKLPTVRATVVRREPGGNHRAGCGHAAISHAHSLAEVRFLVGSETDPGRNDHRRVCFSPCLDGKDAAGPEADASVSRRDAPAPGTAWRSAANTHLLTLPGSPGPASSRLPLSSPSCGPRRLGRRCLPMIRLWARR